MIFKTCVAYFMGEFKSMRWDRVEKIALEAEIKIITKEPFVCVCAPSNIKPNTGGKD